MTSKTVTVDKPDPETTNERPGYPTLWQQSAIDEAHAEMAKPDVYKNYGDVIRQFSRAIPRTPDIANANVWGSNGYDYAQQAIDRYLNDIQAGQKDSGIEPVVGNSFPLDSGYADKAYVPIYYPGIKNEPVAETAYAERQKIPDLAKIIMGLISPAGSGLVSGIEALPPDVLYYADESKRPLQKRPINGK